MRNKPSLVCTTCRKRKIKCDKGRPCRSCIKSNCSFDCTYDSHWVASDLTGLAELCNSSKSSIKGADDDFGEQGSSSKPGSNSKSKKYAKSSFMGVEKSKKKASSLISRQLERTPLDLVKSKYEIAMPLYSTEPFMPQNSKGRFVYEKLIEANNKATNVFQILENSRCESCSRIESCGCNLPRQERVENSCRALTGIYPYGETDEMFLLFSDLVSNDKEMESLSHPFTLKEITSVDRILMFLRFFSQQRSREHAGLQRSSKYARGMSNGGTNSFYEQKQVFENMVIRAREYKRKKEAFNSKNVTHSSLSRNMEYESSTGAQKSQSRSQKLNTEILNLLPNKHSIWLLVENFFQVLDPALQLYDKDVFKQQMSEILGDYENTGDAINLDIKSATQFASIGSLLVMLRLSYLSFISKWPIYDTANTADVKNLEALHNHESIKHHEIDISCVEVAWKCLEYANVIGTESIETLQCNFILSYYCTTAPERVYDVSGLTHQICFSVYSSMAKSLRLNVDLGDHANNTQSSSYIRLRRKIWNCFCNEDTFLYLRFGIPRSIHLFPNGMKKHCLAYHSNDNTEPDCEEAASKIYESTQRELPFIISKLNDLFIGSGQIKMSEITKLLSYIEILTTANFGDLKGYSNCSLSNDKREHQLRLFKIYSFLSLKCFNTNTIVYFYLMYERVQKHALSAIYFKKYLVSVVRHLIPYVNSFFGNIEKIVGHGVNFLLTPYMQQLVHMIVDTLFMFMLRIGHAMYKVVVNPDYSKSMVYPRFAHHYRLMGQLMNVLEFLIQYVSSTLFTFQKKSPVSCGMNETIIFYLNIASSADFFANITPDFESSFQHFTLEDYDEMLGSIHDVLIQLKNERSAYMKPDKISLNLIHDVVPSFIKNMNSTGTSFLPTSEKNSLLQAIPAYPQVDLPQYLVWCMSQRFECPTPANMLYQDNSQHLQFMECAGSNSQGNEGGDSNGAQLSEVDRGNGVDTMWSRMIRTREIANEEMVSNLHVGDIPNSVPIYHQQPIIQSNLEQYESSYSQESSNFNLVVDDFELISSFPFEFQFYNNGYS